MEIEGNAVKEHSVEMVKNREQTAEKFWNLTCTTNIFDEKAWRSNASAILLIYQQFTVDAIK